MLLSNFYVFFVQYGVKYSSLKDIFLLSVYKLYNMSYIIDDNINLSNWYFGP